MSLSAEVEEMDGTHVGHAGDLGDLADCTWQDVLNDTGGGSITLGKENPDRSLLTYNRVVRCKIDGTARFPFLVEKIQQVDEAATAEQETTTYSGRGTLAVFDRAVVGPELLGAISSPSDNRLFNFASPSFDPAANGAVAATATDHTVDPFGYTEPAGFPQRSPSAEWIWSQGGNTDNIPPPPFGDNYLFAPVFYFVGDPMICDVWAAADDAYEFWWNGQLLFQDGYDVGYIGQSKHQVIRLTGSTNHYFRVRATNRNHPELGESSAAGFRAIGLQLDGAGQPIGVLWKTDTSWTVIGYPPIPPGFTPGQVLNIVLDEWEARGGFVVTRTWTNALDSNGTAWPITSDISLQVGMSLLGVIRQMCETYIDVAMSASGFSLSAYVHRGSASGVSLLPGTNIGGLDGVFLSHEATA